jgi:hypothetical protein
VLRGVAVTALCTHVTSWGCVVLLLVLLCQSCGVRVLACMPVTLASHTPSEAAQRSARYAPLGSARPARISRDRTPSKSVKSPLAQRPHAMMGVAGQRVLRVACMLACVLFMGGRGREVVPVCVRGCIRRARKRKQMKSFCVRTVLHVHCSVRCDPPTGSSVLLVLPSVRCAQVGASLFACMFAIRKVPPSALVGVVCGLACAAASLTLCV